MLIQNYLHNWIIRDSTGIIHLNYVVGVVLVLVFRLFMNVITMITIPTTNGMNTIAITLATAPVIVPNNLSIALQIKNVIVKKE
jgi:hypothetical protein